jgi:heme exporter protein D
MTLDFDAGRYAIYVWPAFAISATAFAWMIVDSLAQARRWKRELERLQAEANRDTFSQDLGA